MANLQTITEGMNILTKYKPDAAVEGHHDIINICVTEDEVTDETDRTRLRELNFFICDEADSTWAHH